jgi:hypothetical protein
VTFPAGITTIEVTGNNLLAFDGTPLSGVIIFTPAGTVPVPSADAILQGSATATAQNGAIAGPFVIATTDCVSPGFTYTISFRLTTPDGQESSVPPAENVAIPSTLGASVDLSQLVSGGPAPAATAFSSENTWTAPQVFAGSPPLKVTSGAAAGDVLTSDASGNATWQAPSVVGGGLVAADNLSDLENVAAARSNLGLGSAATQAASAFDAVGAAASVLASSLQKSANLSDLPSAVTALANLGAVASSLLAAVNGVATLDSSALLVRSQLPLSTSGEPPASVGSANAQGTGTEAARWNHVHSALPFSGGVAPRVIALSYAATVEPDASQGNMFTLPLTGSPTIAAPANPTDGETIEFLLTQDSAGSRVVTWAAAYLFGTPGAPVLSTGAGLTDLVGFKYSALLTAWLCVGSVLGF